VPDARFEIVTSERGAPALRDRESGEIMHPGGPLHEAHALYLGPARLVERLAQGGSDPLVLLDVGLGAGSNASCALAAAEGLHEPARRLELLSLDLSGAALRHALDSEQRAAFGFSPTLSKAARSLLETGCHQSARATWRLTLGDALASIVALAEASVDVVFWDPYSPRTNPGMWSEAAFTALRRVCRDGATVHTYGAATATRSALLLAGFFVGLGPARSTKQKHATIASTRLADLARPLDRAWLASFPRAEPSRARDPALSAQALARLRQLPQFA
jgi:queuine tRNA-ribosyltransferase